MYLDRSTFTSQIMTVELETYLWIVQEECTLSDFTKQFVV